MDFLFFLVLLVELVEQIDFIGEVMIDGADVIFFDVGRLFLIIFFHIVLIKLLKLLPIIPND